MSISPCVLWFRVFWDHSYFVRILWSKTTSETGSHRSRATTKHRPLHLRSPPRLALPTPEWERVRVLCMVAQLQTIQRSRTLNSIHPPSTNMVSGRCLSEQHNTREIPLSRASPQSERCRSPQQPQRMAVASLCRNTTWAPVPSQVWWRSSSIGCPPLHAPLPPQLTNGACAAARFTGAAALQGIPGSGSSVVRSRQQRCQAVALSGSGVVRSRQ